MILVWGSTVDTTTASVLHQLRTLDVEVLHVDESAILQAAHADALTAEVAVADGVTGYVRLGEIDIDLARVSAAYIRPYDVATIADPPPPGHPTPSAVSAAIETQRLLWLWADVTPAAVVNRPAAMAPNGTKPFQADQIRRAGFAVPPTLVTTDPHAVVRFWEAHGEVVYKSLSGTRSIVSRLEPAHLPRLDTVSTCPVQFQRFIPGRDVRVHVVGDRLFTAAVDCDADDYRYGPQQGSPARVAHTSIPVDIAHRCRSLACQQGLAVAGIDLRQDSHGDWYCFEINPSPAFSFFDTDEQAIAASVARLLTRASGADW